jgi:tetratricopeptide (TPR) repeat protein
VRRLLAAIALAVTAGCAAPAQAPRLDPALRDLEALRVRSVPDEDPGTVDLLVAPDLAFLERLGSDAVPALERAVATVDRVLGPEVGLRFRIGGVAVFAATPEVRDDLRLLWEARLRLGRGRCDVVAVFSGRRCGERAGAAEPGLRLLLCADASDPERNLLHEAAHLFGAQDYARGHPGYDLASLMSYNSDLPRSLDLDPANLARVRARRGALPAAQPDSVAAALDARMAALPGPDGAALLGAFLCAESREGQAEGLSPAARFLARLPGDPAASRALAECLRVLGRREEASAMFLDALGGIAAAEHPDGLDRHAALEAARLAVDAQDGLAVLMPAAEGALARVAEAFPGDPEVLDLRASLRARAADRATAEALYRAAAAADPAAVYPWRHLAALGRTSGDAELWREGWHGALAADPLDPILAVRWVEEGLRVYPEMIRSDQRSRAEAALEAAERAFPSWPEPAALRERLGAGTAR